ncbi:MAG: hypothetical protein K6E98_05955 [Lachnospiraceae bacterium]|nr:hypothetical protein [Lachnospiraceae bacterium]
MITAKAQNGISKQISVTVKQSPVSVYNEEGNNRLNKCNTISEAVEYINGQWNEDGHDSDRFVIRINEDLVLDEIGSDDSILNLGDKSNYVSFDLSGHTLTVKRSQYSPLLLQTGTEIDNGSLAVTGPDGISVYGAVFIDSLTTEHLTIGSAYEGEVFRANNINVSDTLVAGEKSSSELTRVNVGGYADIMEECSIYADEFIVNGSLRMGNKALLAVNKNGYMNSVELAWSENSYLVRAKDANLTILNDVKVGYTDASSSKLNVGISDGKLNAVMRNTSGKGDLLPVSDISSPSMLYRTGSKKVSGAVAVWLPEGSKSEYTKLAVSSGAVYAVNESNTSP